jgi:hypothetical protein
LLIKFIFHLVVEGKLGLFLAKMLAVSIDLRNPVEELSPVVSQVFHGLRCFNCLFVRQRSVVFGLLGLPLVKHLFEVAIESFDLAFELLDKPGLLVLDLVVERRQPCIELAPHALNLVVKHRFASKLFNHHTLLLDRSKHGDDGLLFSPDFEGVGVHLFNFLNALGVD